MTEFVSRNAVRIGYEMAGSGHPGLVFVHGWSGNRSYFAPQMEHFVTRHRVVSLDLRGCGDSDAPGSDPGDYSVDAMADDVIGVLAAAAVDHPVLVGHSMGALVAISCAARSDAVGGVVMVDPAPMANEQPKAYFRESFDVVSSDLDASWRRAFVEGMFLATDVARRQEIIQAMCAAAPFVAAATLLAIGEYDGIGTLAAVGVPVLSIGSASPSDNPADLRRACPSITIGQTVGSGHFNQLEVPDQVNAMIERFLLVNEPWPTSASAASGQTFAASGQTFAGTAG